MGGAPGRGRGACSECETRQESLWQSQFLVTPKKAKRLEGSWAEVFRNQALPLIDEERFAPMYCADNGRPNRAVQTVLGVHILKEMFNLTDQEALQQLEFNLLWHHALGLDMEETHLPQKTLHNFRVRPQARRPGAVTQAVYFANMALLDRRACRMVAESGGPGWKQPCLRPRLGIPPCRSSGGGWKTQFISPRQDGILLPIPARGAAG